MARSISSLGIPAHQAAPADGATHERGSRLLLTAANKFGC